MITVDVYQIVALIIAIAFLIFIIFTIPTLVQIKRTVRSVEELSLEGKKTIETLNTALRKTGEGVGDLEEILKKIREAGLKLVTVLEIFVDNIKSPLATLVGFILGVQYGLKHLLKKKEKGGESDVNREK